ncbi:MAG: flagellar basal body P-ring formation chaperone FlgA [Lacipirellulaceae bacterium]
MNRPLPLAAVLMAAVSLASGPLVPSVALGADVLLRDEARPAGSIVRLADVATIESTDAAEVERLEGLPLMPAPAPGETTYLRAAAVRELLQAQGQSLATIRFDGASTTRIIGKRAPAGAPLEATAAAWRPADRSNPLRATPVSGRGPGQTGFLLPRSVASAPAPTAWPVEPAALGRGDRERTKERVRVAAEAWVAAADENKAIEIVSVSLEAPAAKAVFGWGEGTLSVEPADELAIGDEPTPATFRVRPGRADLDQTAEATITLARMPVAVVATMPIPRGQMVAASMVALRAVPMKERPRARGAYGGVEYALGKEALTAIPKGAPLSDANCASPILVRRGETVTVVTGSDGIRVRMEAVAQATGRGGDIVSVQHAERKDKFDARVVGPRMLAVLGASSGTADGTAPLDAPASPYTNFTGSGGAR